MFTQILKVRLVDLKRWGLLIALSTFIACNGAQNTAQDAITRTLEKTIIERSGTKVDLGAVDQYANTSAIVSFSTADKVYLKANEKLKGTALFQKENDIVSISFQISDENGKALIATINHIPKTFTLPIIGKFMLSNSYDGINPVATFMYMQANETMITSPTPFEGTLTILKLNEKEVVFEMEAKGGEPIDAENPSAWKGMSAKGVITSPIIQTFGIDKKDILR